MWLEGDHGIETEFKTQGLKTDEAHMKGTDKGNEHHLLYILGRSDRAEKMTVAQQGDLGGGFGRQGHSRRNFAGEFHYPAISRRAAVTTELSAYSQPPVLLLHFVPLIPLAVRPQQPG